MKIEKLKSIARLYEFLTKVYQPVNYQHFAFDGNYIAYEIIDLKFKQKSLNIIENLRSINVVDFYNLDYLQKHNFPPKYYNSEVVKKSEKQYGFHYQTIPILFHYLLYQFKDATIQFLDILDSDEFIQAFGYWIKMDEFYLKYPLHMHNEIFKYLSSKIDEFPIVHSHFTCLTDAIYNDGYTSFYRLKTISNCIDSLESFDFSKINLLNE